MRILFKYPTRSRRGLFLRGIESIQQNASSNDYHILVSAEPETIDPTMYPLPQIENVSYHIEKTNNKVHAYNNGINENCFDFNILVCMSDDMVFIKKGFDNIIRDSLKEFNDCLIHFPDGNRNDLITLPIMGREYYERFRYVYHPSYVSVYCDNEQMDVAKELGCYQFIDKQIFEHKHPAYGKANMDALYVNNESYYSLDSENYKKRKLNGFA